MFSERVTNTYNHKKVVQHSCDEILCWLWTKHLFFEKVDFSKFCALIFDFFEDFQKQSKKIENRSENFENSTFSKNNFFFRISRKFHQMNVTLSFGWFKCFWLSQRNKRKGLVSFFWPIIVLLSKDQKSDFPKNALNTYSQKSKNRQW